MLVLGAGGSQSRDATSNSIPIIYKGRVANGQFRPDLIANGVVIVEVKSVEKLLPVHEAQVLTYLKLTQIHVGLIINFNTPAIRQGLKRISL
ncbi:MAG TPA: GxxExxY protein [Gemmatimonadaceae bacterium]|nr:GxxExxY protein [Gemmatimonadaceae bacterium]